MNYKKVYDIIIENRRKNKLRKSNKIYTELHHITPKSLGGSDSKKNLVRVTAREHFICHALLVRYYKKINDVENYHSMLYAFNNMKAGPKGSDNSYFNSRLFEKYKEDFSKLQSERQSGEFNSQYDTMWITNDLLEENKKIKSSEEIPDGWKSGRIMDYKKYKENKQLYTKLAIYWNNNNYTWNEFKNKFNIKCSNYGGFKKLCKKYTTIELIDKTFYRHGTEYYINEEYYNKRKLELKEYYKSLYLIYKENKFKDFCKITNYDKDCSNLIQYFKRYLGKDYKEIY